MANFRHQPNGRQFWAGPVWLRPTVYPRPASTTGVIGDNRPTMFAIVSWRIFYYRLTETVQANLIDFGRRIPRRSTDPVATLRTLGVHTER